jgi:hypothetical protein
MPYVLYCDELCILRAVICSFGSWQAQSKLCKLGTSYLCVHMRILHVVQGCVLSCSSSELEARQRCAWPRHVLRLKAQNIS